VTQRTPVTAIVPVHNAGPVVLATVASLVEQDHRPLQVLVVVDGSTNDDEDRLRSAFGDRIRLVVQENRGLPQTLNHALADLVDTPLVARLDHDDVALPGRITAQVDLLEQAGADVVLSAYWRVGGSGRRLSRHPDLPEAAGPVPYDPRRFGQIVHSTLLARTEVLLRVGGYRPELWPADDYDLSIRLWRDATVVVDPVPRVDYLVGEDTGTNRNRNRMASFTRYLELDARSEPGTLPPLDDWVAANPIGFIEGIRLRGRWLYRRAGAAFGDGRRVTGAVRLAGALALDPRYTLRRLRPARRAQADNRSTSPT
jgi:glycosyltransferase involved in cell wall biosynthesis